MLQEIKSAAFELVREIYNHTYDLSYEPSNTTDELSMLRILLGGLADILLDDKYTKYDLSGILESLYNHVEKTGRSVNHIWGNGTYTGTWGVRSMQICKLFAMHHFTLPIPTPQYDKPGYTFIIPNNPAKGDATICDVTSVTYNSDMVIYRIRPRIFTVNDVLSVSQEWTDCSFWQSLYYHMDDKPNFLNTECYPRYNG